MRQTETQTSETLEGITTRTVTFSWNGQGRVMPAGTVVYVRERKGYLRIRIPGTLFEQSVSGDTIEVP